MASRLSLPNPARTEKGSTSLLCTLYGRTRSGFNNSFELSFAVGFVWLVLYLVSYGRIYKLFIKKKKKEQEEKAWFGHLENDLCVLHINGPIN